MGGYGDAIRSIGSVIKPCCNTAMLDAGELPPDCWLQCAHQIAGYTRKILMKISGPLEAKKHCTSLNIMRAIITIYGFQNLGTKSMFFELGGLTKSANHYGLTLILGRMKGTFMGLMSILCYLASTVSFLNASSSEYIKNEFTHQFWSQNEL